MTKAMLSILQRPERGRYVAPLHHRPFGDDEGLRPPSALTSAATRADAEPEMNLLGDWNSSPRSAEVILPPIRAGPRPASRPCVRYGTYSHLGIRGGRSAATVRGPPSGSGQVDGGTPAPVAAGAMPVHQGFFIRTCS